ncbi:hypothetical protein GCM10010441_29400 [Kitasatospora paracochleata]|uniref:Glycosyltransferase involved in cell wall biosynthesis/FMN phosphatase YigB (HAD superfamily) n=1 Tax=Kitasatospora paracochleata TaxID=58354 RepID=A0ABT1JB61_9ACTN|nr:HAD-IA family hydrolase [Kitasatospora paracochleata]MCP2313901.1 glycosyltransferase involved in cell wall biosynthesis/FMN phosphatase YigB (HAD superfamily) [Kitasatospora paracochleata]
MRLLILTATFHPLIGGAETYAFQVAQLLAARRHQVTVATDLPSGHQPGEQIDGDPAGVRVERLSSYRTTTESTIAWEQMAFGLLPELQYLVDDFRPDILLSNSLDTAITAKMLALGADIPWAAAFHEQQPEAEPLGAGRLRMVYETLRPDLVLAGSAFYAARALHWAPDLATALIHHGVDTDLFHPARREPHVRERYGLTREHLLIVCAGRLKHRKGMHNLLPAFAEIHRRHPETRLLIAGSVNSASRAYADQLHAQIGALELDGVVTVDETVPYTGMPALLAEADIVAQPSLAEGLGLAVLEAMASGTPVITTDIPGTREITTRSDIALVVAPDQVPPLAKALDQLVTDPHVRKSLGERARAHVEEHFSHARMADHTQAALADLITASASRRTAPSNAAAAHVSSQAEPAPHAGRSLQHATAVPKALLLDIGMTVIHPSSTVLGEELRQAGHRSPFEPDRLTAALVLAAEARHLPLPVGISGDDKVALAWGRALGVPDPIALRAFHTCLRRPDLYSDVDPDAHVALRRLREQGIRLAAVANSEGALEDELAATGMRGYFEVVIDSSQVGVEKPRREIFDIAVNALSLSPDQCWFLGDGLVNDVLGARAARIALPLLYDRYDLYGHLPATASVNRLTEVPDAIDRLRRPSS